MNKEQAKALRDLARTGIATRSELGVFAAVFAASTAPVEHIERLPCKVCGIEVEAKRHAKNDGCCSRCAR